MSPCRRKLNDDWRPYSSDHGYGLCQVRVDPHGELARKQFKSNSAFHRGERVIPTSNHYHDGDRFRVPTFGGIDPILKRADQVARKMEMSLAYREHWWDSWPAFWRYHKRMFNLLANEKHHACLPLMDLREAAQLREPTWAEEHWRGLYISKWVGGVFLLLQLLRI